MERVMLTLPPDMLSAVDAFARRTGQKRSQVVRRALSELLERHERQEFEALLAEGYQAMADDAAAAAADWLPLQAAAADGVWRWEQGEPDHQDGQPRA
jgi:metal-responsive CopG/Arc/MetJ family transcriptional regulator